MSNSDNSTDAFNLITKDLTTVEFATIKEAYELGRKHERTLVSKAVRHIFYSVVRHPAHAQSDLDNILVSVATAIRTGAHATSLEEDDE